MKFINPCDSNLYLRINKDCTWYMSKATRQSFGVDGEPFSLRIIFKVSEVPNNSCILVGSLDYFPNKRETFVFSKHGESRKNPDATYLYGHIGTRYQYYGVVTDTFDKPPLYLFGAV
ncbi:hypothetical protein ABH892_004468 [Paenibacillus sp. RC254]